MLCNEKKYEFRNRLRAVHKKDVRDCLMIAGCNEFGCYTVASAEHWFE